MAVIVDDATEAVLLDLPGVEAVQLDHPATVTTDPRSDDAPSSDGVARGPVRLAVRAILVLPDDEIDALRDTLTVLQTSGHAVSWHPDYGVPVARLQVGSFGFGWSARAMAPLLTLELIERLAQRVVSTTVQVRPRVAATVGPPPTPTLPGLAQEQPHGATSLLLGAGQAIGSALGGGS